MKLLTAFLSLFPLTAFALTPSELAGLLKENSLDLLIAEKKVESSLYSRKAVEREFLPTLSLSAGFEEFYPDIRKSWNQNYSVGAAVSAEPLNFQRFVRLKVEGLRVEVEKERLRETFLEQLYLALKELYRMKSYLLRISYKKGSLESAERILKVAEEKYEKGLVMITDVLKAKSEVEKVRGELSSLEAEYDQSFNRLNELLNFSLKKGEKPEVELKEEKPRFEVNNLVKEAFSLRPEIRRAEKELGVSSLQVDYEKSRLRPSLSLSLSMRRSGTTFWPEERSYSWSVNLNFPLFDSGQSTYRALEKDREREIALLKLKKLKNRIKREVLDVVADIESSYRNLKSDYAFLEFSKKAYDRALNEYKLGVSDIVALMQAFDTLKRAEDRYVSSLLAYNLALLSLKKATGKLLLEVER